MEISFRLAQFLAEHHANGRGVIKKICGRTALERHQVAALLKNQAKYISIDSIGALCSYLAREYRTDPGELLGSLFGIEPGGFWQLLATRSGLEICLGVRQSKELAERGWVMASDTYLQGTVLHGISGAYGARSDVSSERHEPKKEPGSQVAQIVEQQLVLSPGKGSKMEAVCRDAMSVYREFSERSANSALVCLGSMKSNPVVEMVLARAFRAEPFIPLSGFLNPRDYPVPFLFRYREEDEQPPSVCGCLEVPNSEDFKKPGIYYETEEGDWRACEWSNESADAALVFYQYRPPEGRLEMVLGGFSGRATRCLAQMLHASTAKLWPPNYSSPELKIGAFIVKFAFKSSSKRPSLMEPPEPSTVEVIPIPESALARRLER